MKMAGVATGLVAVLLLAGCTADPQSTAENACADQAALSKHRDDPEPAEKVTVSEVSSRVDPTGTAYDVDGQILVAYPHADDLATSWTCFAQTVDGETYADIQSFG